jgi:ribosomal protein S18 acetylase RimI-like enzyme
VKKEIKEITGGNLEKSVEIIRAGFGTVAREMGYTEAIVPVFPAFIKVEHLKALKDRGGIFFGAFIDGKQAGFIAVEKENDGNYHLKRLAVSPEYRHDGLGKMLIDHAIAYIKNKGHNKVYLVMADENPVLKKWYLDMGFKETSVKKFDHLPFPVSFMEKDIVHGD